MAKSRSSKSKSSGGGIFAGVFIGLGLAGAGYLLYTHSYSIQNFFVHGNSAPHESKATKKLVAKMAKAAKDAPFGPSEDVFESGAHLYVANCAHCHGTPRHDAREGQSMHPAADQFWNSHHDDDLEHQTAPEVYEAIANGDAEKGMPAYAAQLTDTQIWQLTLLLRSSRLELPDPVMHILATSASK